MKGMDMMLSKVIGMSPDEMKAKAEEFERFVRSASEAMVQMAETQKQILSKLEGLENGR